MPLTYVVYGPKLREDDKPMLPHQRIAAIFPTRVAAEAFKAYKNEGLERHALRYRVSAFLNCDVSSDEDGTVHIDLKDQVY